MYKPIQFNIPGMHGEKLRFFEYFLEYNGSKIFYEKITDLSYHLVRHYINYVPAGTTYNILFQGDGERISINFKSGTFNVSGEECKAIFSGIIKFIDKIVKPYLLSNLIKALRGSGSIKIGSLIITEDGIEQKIFLNDVKFTSWQDLDSLKFQAGNIKIYRKDKTHLCDIPLSVSNAVMLPLVFYILKKEQEGEKEKRVSDPDSTSFLVFDFLKKYAGLIIIGLIILGFIFINRGENARIRTDDNLVDNSFIEVEKQVSKQEFPELAGSRNTDFQWEFNNREYKISMNLYKSVYDYYSNQPKVYMCDVSCPFNWEEEYFDMFLETPGEDSTFLTLASEIKKLGKNYGLSDDQIIEMAVAFVQSIAYDELKAANMLSLSMYTYSKFNTADNSSSPRYPYEVLYDKKGICSGKSFLGALLIKELGYGVSIFDYDQEEHMAIGIKCPKEYSSYNSGYCFTELTTSGWKIGLKDMESFGVFGSTDNSSSLTSVPEIYGVADGRIYKGIYQTIEKMEELENLDEEIDKIEKRLEGLEQDLNYYNRIGNYTSYNNLVSVYNNLVATQRVKVGKYNNLIDELFPGPSEMSIIIPGVVIKHISE